MATTTKNPPATHDEALQLLEDAKKQYEQYCEASGIYNIHKLANPDDKEYDAPVIIGHVPIAPLAKE